MTQALTSKNSFQKYNYFIKTIANKLFQTDSIREVYEIEKKIALKEKIKTIKSNELNDSIIYAKRIQEGMMLKENTSFDFLLNHLYCLNQKILSVVIFIGLQKWTIK